MTRILRRCTYSFVLVLALATSAAAQQHVGDGPPPEIRAHIDAFVKAFNSGNPDAWEAMAQAHFSPAALQRRTAAQRKDGYQSLRRDFGNITITRVERNAPDAPLEISVKGDAGASGTFTMELEAEAPYRIERLGVRIGGPAGDDEKSSVPAPTVNGQMNDAAIAQALDAYFTQLTAADTFSGNVVVAKDGKAVFEKSYGYADRANKLANNSATRFNLGSINKTFTQAAIQQLVGKGKLALTDTLGKLIPDYPQQETRAATVEQLLHHTAGVANFFGEEFDHTNKDRFRSNADYYKWVAAMKPQFAPGARREYCNGCYIVLGEIIARVSGMPYEQYIAENVFKPAGMNASGALQSDGINANVAIGYTRREGNDLHANFLMHGASGSAAGGGYSTARDLLAYSEAARHGRIPGVAASEGMGIAGGAPGINAALEENGPWTIIVLTNFDPPAGEQLAGAVSQALAH